MFTISFALGQDSLPRSLTAEEKTRLHEIGANRTITDPPDSILYAPAEFDSVAGIIFAWESYYNLLRGWLWIISLRKSQLQRH